MKRYVSAFIFVFVFASVLYAEEAAKGKGGGMPPAAVVVGDVEKGEAEPVLDFVGTVFYSRVTKVASEVGGRVLSVLYEEGDRIKRAQVLVRLDTEFVENSIRGAEASYEQARVELENAEKDLGRIEALYKEDSIAETVYDDQNFKVLGLRKKVEGLGASLERLKLTKRKMRIKAPFKGVIIDRNVEKGEWVSEGGTVAVLADNAEVDVVVDVPSDVLSHLKNGKAYDVRIGGRAREGVFTSIVPKGDVATRTFSVKLRVKDPEGLIEGMEAVATLPAGPSVPGLLLSRDAVINMFGQDMVFAVRDSSAAAVPVRVLGYKGTMAGVEPLMPGGLNEGDKVVVKGNERLRDGQGVAVTGAAGK